MGAFGEALPIVAGVGGVVLGGRGKADGDLKPWSSSASGSYFRRINYDLIDASLRIGVLAVQTRWFFFFFSYVKIGLNFEVEFDR